MISLNGQPICDHTGGGFETEVTLGQLADQIEAMADDLSLSPHRAASAGRGGIPGGGERA